jgi:predicted MFS family arabinose efflux permease
MTAWPYWFELAVIFGISAFGGIFFGHFEERTPRWRKVLKLLLIGLVSVVISATAGREWFFVMVGATTVFVVIIHASWLPRKGINGWTAEPKEKYHALRGWTVERGMKNRDS